MTTSKEKDINLPLAEKKTGSESTQQHLEEVIESRDLIGPDGTIRILHSGEVYTLRITRNNRLILTK